MLAEQPQLQQTPTSEELLGQLVNMVGLNTKMLLELQGQFRVMQGDINSMKGDIRELQVNYLELNRKIDLVHTEVGLIKEDITDIRLKMVN